MGEVASDSREIQTLIGLQDWVAWHCWVSPSVLGAFFCKASEQWKGKCRDRMESFYI